TKHTRLVIARLRPRSNSTYLDKTKSEIGHLFNVFGIFVETCSQPHRILKFQTKHFTLQVGIFYGINRFQQGLHPPHFGQGTQGSGHCMVCLLRSHRKEKWFYQFVHNINEGFCYNNSSYRATKVEKKQKYSLLLQRNDINK